MMTWASVSLTEPCQQLNSTISGKAHELLDRMPFACFS